MGLDLIKVGCDPIEFEWIHAIVHLHGVTVVTVASVSM